MKKKPTLKMLNVKTNARDRKALLRLAKKHTQGSLSAWLRHASLNYKPKRGEKIKILDYK